MDHTYDLCVRSHLVDNALDLYASLAKAKHGKIIFLAGELGSGRSATLKSMHNAFNREYPHAQVISGYFLRNEFISSRNRVPLREILTAIGEACPLVSLLSFAGALVSTGVASWGLIQALLNESPADYFAFTEKLLRHASAKKPMVCLLENINQAEIGWWSDLLLKLGPRLAVNLPVLMILSIDGPTALDSADENDSSLLYVYHELVDSNQAEWWPLLPLTKDEIKSWIGYSETRIVDRIYEITTGNPEWVRQLWEFWITHKVVNRGNPKDEWQFDPSQEDNLLDPVHNILADRLKLIFGVDNIREQGEAIKLLSLAALEGSTFTADAVARYSGENSDETIDFFDDYLVQSEENVNGILLEEGILTINDPHMGTRHLCRYRFISELYWMTLLRYGITDPGQRSEICKKLGAILIDLYAGVEEIIAENLVRVFIAAEDQERAKHYRRMFDFRQSLVSLYQQALLIINDSKEEWDNLKYRWAIDLFEVLGERMVYKYPFDECLLIHQELYNMKCFLYGPEHIDVAGCLNNLALLYSNYGKYEESEPLFQRTLEICDRVLGSDHPNTVAVLNNLAGLYANQGLYAEAEPLFQRTLEIIERVLGPDHPHTASSLNNLALLYKEQGRYTEAEPLFQHALEIYTKALGIEHPITQICLKNLTILCESQNKTKVAKEVSENPGEEYEGEPTVQTGIS